MAKGFAVFAGLIVLLAALGGVFAGFYHGWKPITGYLTGQSALVLKLGDHEKALVGKLDELQKVVQKMSEKLDALQKMQAEANKR